MLHFCIFSTCLLRLTRSTTIHLSTESRRRSIINERFYHTSSNTNGQFGGQLSAESKVICGIYATWKRLMNATGKPLRTYTFLAIYRHRSSTRHQCRRHATVLSSPVSSCDVLPQRIVACILEISYG